MRPLRSLPGDRRGLSAVEFAMLAPVMILLTAGTIEAAHLATVQVTLEGAVSEAARSAIATLELPEAERELAMRTHINRRMAFFPIQDGGQLVISTTVYRTFGSTYPEAFQDANSNGVYDTGETFDDRNRNNARDVAAPVTGTMGDIGDVVSYTATFPSALYFDFLASMFGAQPGFPVKASVVVRNEPVRRGGTT